MVIGANTQRLVEDLFTFDDLGEQRLKGISRPIKAYRVRVESDAPSRFEAKAARGLTPLVGREEEVGLLLKRWDQARMRFDKALPRHIEKIFDTGLIIED